MFHFSGMSVFMQQLYVAMSFALTPCCIINHILMWEDWDLKNTDTLSL